VRQHKLGRREFVKSAVGAGVALGALGRAAPAHARVLGANDRINVAVIGTGGRGTYLLRWVMETGGQIEPPPPPFGGSARERKPPDPALATQVVAVCDVYAKRKNAAAEFARCDSTLDYRQVLDRSDVDAVIIATPDHWHARMALEAMAKGKDVYLEKPVTHTVEEAKEVAAAVKKTGRILQVGSQTTSSDQWWKARQAIQDGMIGRLLMSQGSYHRNSDKGEWTPPHGPGTPTASSASGSTGITPGEPPPTSSTTCWRRSTSAGARPSSRAGCSGAAETTCSPKTGGKCPTRSCSPPTIPRATPWCSAPAWRTTPTSPASSAAMRARS
jgi:hypothetical protein